MMWWRLPWALFRGTSTEFIATPMTRHDRVKYVADQIWRANGKPYGTAEQDWAEAERLLDQGVGKPTHKYAVRSSDRTVDIWMPFKVVR